MSFGAYGASGGDVGGGTLHADAVDWAARVAANSGTLTDNSLGIASRFLKQCELRSWNRKLLWIAPMLGANLAAARTPLRDWLGGGVMTNTSFVDGDFSERVGLIGNGSSKILNTGIYPVQLARAAGLNNGGLGVWMTAVDGSGTATEPIGCYNTGATQRFVLDLRNAGSHEFICWGSAGNLASSGANASPNHYYGQRASATSRVIYKNGSSLASNTTSDTASGSGDTQIRLMGTNLGFAKGTCGLAYMTSGDLTAAEVLDLHGCLKTYLMEASGKL